MKTYFAIIFPTQNAPRLALQCGKVLIHLPNYMKIMDVAPKITDESAQVVAFQASDDQVHTVRDGGVDILHLWAGDKNSRSRPQDLITVELVGTSGVGGNSPTHLAQANFAGLPDEIKLAAVLTHVSDETLASACGEHKHIVEHLNRWANHTIAHYTKG